MNALLCDDFLFDSHHSDNDLVKLYSSFIVDGVITEKAKGLNKIFYAWRFSLSNRDLNNYNLKGICLNYAALENSNLSHANLIEADLTGASMQGANLEEADLRKAIIKNANLRLANLTRAKLTDTNFSSSKLMHANFRGAVLNQSDFSNANLNYCNIDKDQLQNCNITGATIKKLSNKKYYKLWLPNGLKWTITTGTAIGLGTLGAYLLFENVPASFIFGGFMGFVPSSIATGEWCGKDTIANQLKDEEDWE